MKTVMIISAAALAFMPSAVFAEGQARADDMQKIEVNYGDLDLRLPADQHRLMDRIRYAAYRLCLAEQPATPSPMAADPACLDRTFGAVAVEVNHAIARAGGETSLATSARR